ncbi:integrase [Sphaerisporangium sp. NPDC051011]|uniref:integrase n=1 Tax=Sphaerisporangium sp. NPDC051011 TaxID=3155792 RepID=UPI0033C74BD3
MIDFFKDDGTPWARRLWDVGSLLALEELWEVGTWQAQGVLSPASCDWQRAELRALIGPDRGLGERDLRKEITDLLSVPLPDPSPARRRLREIIEHARWGYLERWAEAAVLPGRPGPERFSRTVAAHLLDLGYSTRHLLAWATGLYNNHVDTREIADSAAELARAHPRPFVVLIALSGVPHRELAEPLVNWMSKGDVIAWLREHGYDASGMRPGGGFLYRLTALDAYGAAAQARQKVERMVARSLFLRRHRGGIIPHPYIWVAGHPVPIRFDPPARSADLLTLVNEGHLYQVEGVRSRIDDVLELAAPVNQGPLGPAVAGAWAAIEALLTHPDDPKEMERSGKAVAADRLAAIIACSWPRAELTALAHHHKPPKPDDLAERIAACTRNRERARCVAEALVASDVTVLDFSGARTKHSDSPAATRMAALLADPRRVLGEVMGTYRIALRRLYRTRNIVLHGGAIQGVALQASLRTAAPLVGAGLDRIVHANQAEGLAPLDLAARAEVALRLVGGETGLSVVDLLEPVLEGGQVSIR